MSTPTIHRRHGAPSHEISRHAADISFRGEKLGADDFNVYVIVDGHERLLQLRLDLRNHSPTGFCWGYTGSGPAQLALAMCAELVDAETALRAYQFVKSRLIATLPMDVRQWSISGASVREEIDLALR